MSQSSPSPDATSGCVKRKHTPPAEQLEGGSWVFDTVRGIYQLESRTIQDGRVLPSPVDPSVYDTANRIAAEAAKAGDYTLMSTFTPPDSYLKPNPFPEWFSSRTFQQQLCHECSLVAERLHYEILSEQNSQHRQGAGRSPPSPFEGQLDIDIKPSIEALSDSAEDGCVLCSFILEKLEHMPRRIEQHAQACGSRVFPIQLLGIQGEFYRLLVWFRHPQDHDLRKRTRAFDLCATFPMDPAKFPVYSNHIGVRLSHNFLSDNTVNFFDMWLDECKDKHAACNAYYEKTWRFPTRLIDVGDAFHEPRLVVEPDPEEEVGYATLSYCWGKSFNSRTTLANLEQHKACIPMHELSPTLRQAIQLARHLNVQYLWADSLCIIQDSKEDWDAESVRMAEIYRNSLFTIAAPRARSSMEGIFPEAGERRRPVQITSGRTPVPLFIDSVPLGWDRCIEEDALSERGWVLQERLLSCRTLFIGDQQLFWECKTTRASQHQYSNLAGEEDIVKAPESIFNKIPEIKDVDKLALQSLRDDSDRDYLAWYQTIRKYSTKNLTFSTDKLPAVAGIAQAFGHPDDIYVAGTWLTDWLGGLLWEPLEPRTMRLPHGLQRPRAPSWSWASLDGEISFPLMAPDYDLVRKLKNGTLGSDNLRAGDVNPANPASAALEVTHNAEENQDKEKEEKTEPVVEPVTSPLAGSEHQAEPGTGGTVIEIGLAGVSPDASRLGGLFAELLDVGHPESDFMGKQTEITLTLRGHAEWVDARSSTGKPDPPSTYNEWTGTYDDFTDNWSYSLDRGDQEEPCRCLRLVMMASGRNCRALLLKQRPDSRFERVGTAIADCFMVDFMKLMEPPRETVILC